MALTNPNKLINVQELSYFESKLALKYQTQAIAAITGLTATTVEGALAEILGKVNALPSAIVPKGTKAFSGLTPATDLVESKVGWMWNISDSFTTTDDFVEGAGKVIPAGANVYVANPESGVYKYDVFQGMVDLSGYKTIDSLKSKGSATKGVYFDANGDAQAMTYSVGIDVPADAVFTDTTYESKVAAEGGTDVSLVTTGEKYAWNAKYDKPATGIAKTDLAQGVQDSLDLADSALQAADIEGKANKSEMSVAPGTGADADKTTITLKTGTSATVLTTHQDISGKADKVASATADNFAGLDANGNLKDSGYKASDFQAAGSYKTTQTAVADPTAGNTPVLEFIATISQNANGEITATKQGIQVAANSDIDEIFA